MSHRNHVAADVSGVVDVALLDDPIALVGVATSAAVDGGATVLDVLSHHFDPQGVSVVVLLAESHLSVHTWPESRECYVDVFTCGDVDPLPIVGRIVDRLGGAVRWCTVGKRG